MNQAITKVNSDDKRMKIDKFILKKIVLGKVRGDLFLYISFRSDYKVSSYCYSIFLLVFRSPFLIASSSLYTLFPLSSLSSTCRPDGWS